jgi:hypothetical protein
MKKKTENKKVVDQPRRDLQLFSSEFFHFEVVKMLKK